ncbi:hypothetical protein BDY19DRAFT_983649 [Irpex rosettiformis]|uniref:Uncharacterized protein n=1 Tax=Irpex rosettiformis TaxID=378272 RepID=A0ACB8UD26_9APHY|nr:hypothetical protein BDY19DRAFT_983649 [Irpex rosettiformis]
MAPSRTTKGKKRAHNPDSDLEASDAASTSCTSVHEEAIVKVKKQRRAVTKKCPVCDEEIPVRLLDRHVDLEAERVEDIIRAIGSTEVLSIAEPDDGFTARTRKSAIKARKSMQPGSHSHDSATLEIVDKQLRLVKRHRKQRHAKLRDMTREDEDTEGLSGFRGGRGRWAGSSQGTLCPVCMKMVPGDEDVVEAHVDACLAHEARMQEEMTREVERLRREEEHIGNVDIEGDIRILATDGASFRGLGFAIRDHGQQDVDDEVDVDGEDDLTYGAAQFTEGDVVNPLDHRSNEDDDVDIDSDGDPPPQGGSSSSGEIGARSLRNLVVAGKVVKKTAIASSTDEARREMNEVISVAETLELDRAVEQARKSGDSWALVEALNKKLAVLEATKVSSSTSLLCRICLDPYVDPTVSTGCWHTCCRECWLRCLGSTRQCPICKRITAAADLRRVYL